LEFKKRTREGWGWAWGDLLLSVRHKLHWEGEPQAEKERQEQTIERTLRWGTERGTTSGREKMPVGNVCEKGGDF